MALAMEMDKPKPSYLHLRKVVSKDAHLLLLSAR
jgi:hypothetical protein